MAARKYGFSESLSIKINLLEFASKFRSPLGPEKITIEIAFLDRLGPKTLEGLSFFEFARLCRAKRPRYVVFYSALTFRLGRPKIDIGGIAQTTLFKTTFEYFPPKVSLKR